MIIHLLFLISAVICTFLYAGGYVFYGHTPEVTRTEQICVLLWIITVCLYIFFPPTQRKQ